MNIFKINIVLASNSPRRKELLESMGYIVEVVKLSMDESYPKTLNVKKIAEFIADKKMDTFFKQNEGFDGIVLSADTIVVKEGKILGKPTDKRQAFGYLKGLSNSCHEVITGVCIRFREYKICFSDISKVYFDKLSYEEIEYYINNFKVFDKAGGYAIQEWVGLAKISKIVGSYSNIVGLPTQKVYQNLKEIIEKIN